MKKYGLFIAYSPTTDLRIHGLGRYFAGFLKGASERADIVLLIACPSWLRGNIQELCKAERIPTERVEFLFPPGLPISLRLYFAMKRFAARPRRPSFIFRLASLCRSALYTATAGLHKRIVSTRSILLFASLGVILTAGIVAASLVALALQACRALGEGFRRVWQWTSTTGVVKSVRARVRQLAWAGDKSPLERMLYEYIQSSEIDALVKLIESRKEVIGWYCPAAFWPNFNRVAARRLMCVPDVVLGDFPVGFARASGQLAQLENVERAIKSADQLIVYSSHEKWHTLVDKYNCRSDAVHVIPHAASVLGEYVQVLGTADDEGATDVLCREHLMRAFLTAGIDDYIREFKNRDVKFLFFASQFRPNKNIIALLRAYDELLKRRFAGLKLILTGNPDDQLEVQEFVRVRDLTRDVIFLRGLPIQQLASCYRLAELVVNPSLFEGGFPFSATEALSVGTPVVMARIPVTEEVITDFELQSLMLFDPYDWRDMADRIEWAVTHRSELLSRQRPLYERLAKRTWRHVVDEHIEILDRLAAEKNAGEAKA